MRVVQYDHKYTCEPDLKNNHILVMHVNWILPGNLDLSGAPFTLQVIATDHTDGLPAAIYGVCNVFHDGFA